MGKNKKKSAFEDRILCFCRSWVQNHLRLDFRLKILLAFASLSHLIRVYTCFGLVARNLGLYLEKD